MIQDLQKMQKNDKCLYIINELVVKLDEKVASNITLLGLTQNLEFGVKWRKELNKLGLS